MNLQGAVDLGAVAAAREAQAKAAQVAAERAANPIANALIIDVTTAVFEQEVLKRSMTVPVVVDLWATWCEPCKQLSPILEKLALEYDGRWILAKVDVDAEQQIAIHPRCICRDRWASGSDVPGRDARITSAPSSRGRTSRSRKSWNL